MKLTTKLTLLVMLAALSACDVIRDSSPFDTPTVVISPGYKVHVSGLDVPIEGFDSCPRLGAVFSDQGDEASTNCIVLAAERSSVPVRIFLPSGAIVEIWRLDDQVSEVEPGANRKPATTLKVFKRPDGSTVLAAKG